MPSGQRHRKSRLALREEQCGHLAHRLIGRHRNDREPDEPQDEEGGRCGPPDAPEFSPGREGRAHGEGGEREARQREDPPLLRGNSVPMLEEEGEGEGDARQRGGSQGAGDAETPGAGGTPAAGGVLLPLPGRQDGRRGEDGEDVPGQFGPDQGKEDQGNQKPDGEELRHRVGGSGSPAEESSDHARQPPAERKTPGEKRQEENRKIVEDRTGVA